MSTFALHMEVMTNGDNFNFISMYEIQIERERTLQKAGTEREKQRQSCIQGNMNSLISSVCVIIGRRGARRGAM